MHTPSIPLGSERGDWTSKPEPKKCISCGSTLPSNQQDYPQDYYKCECGYSSVDFVR